MASKSFSEEDFSCPVCCDIFKDPLLLTCTHSICKSCLKTFWETKRSKECPVCRRLSSQDPPLNRHLKNLCETFQQERNKRKLFCSQHSSELKLYCEDDKQLVCLVCRDSKLHKNHNFSPISEAVLERKEELKVKLQSLQKKLDTFKQSTTKSDESDKHITMQAQNTERLIKEEFEKLHKFLRDEEATRLAALRKEEKQKRQRMKERIEKMRREILSISDTITAIEGEMEADDITFLQNYKSTGERAQCTLHNPEGISEGALINVAKHLGNLNFSVWEKMKRMIQYTPVTLDPNTANPKLIMSKDLTSVRLSDERQQLPDNPERFSHLSSVLGSESFIRGTHSWDVEVGDSDAWIIGVTENSVNRKGNRYSQQGWYIQYLSGTFKAYPTVLPAPNITEMTNLKKIRVDLNCDKGEVTFSNVQGRTICTHNFTAGKEIIPYFFTSSSLSITTWKAEVKVDRKERSCCIQ